MKQAVVSIFSTIGTITSVDRKKNNHHEFNGVFKFHISLVAINLMPLWRHEYMTVPNNRKNKYIL